MHSKQDVDSSALLNNGATCLGSKAAKLNKVEAQKSYSILSAGSRDIVGLRSRASFALRICTELVSCRMILSNLQLTI